MPPSDVPVCANPEPEIYGVSKAERVDILCRVHANPSEVRSSHLLKTLKEFMKYFNTFVCKIKNTLDIWV